MWGEGEGAKNMTYLVLEEGQEIAMGEVIDDLLCKTQRRITPWESNNLQLQAVRDVDMFCKNQRNETLRNRYKVDIESSEIVRLDLVWVWLAGVYAMECNRKPWKTVHISWNNYQIHEKSTKSRFAQFKIVHMVALDTELGSQGTTDEVAINVVPILAQHFLQMFMKVTKS